MSLAYPWITVEQLEQQLGAPIDATVGDRIVMTATEAIAGLVTLEDSEGEPLDAVPDAVVTAALFIASELYKAGVGIDGTLQVNWIENVPATVNTVLIRRYGVLLAPWLSTSGLVS